MTDWSKFPDPWRTIGPQIAKGLRREAEGEFGGAAKVSSEAKGDTTAAFKWLAKRQPSRWRDEETVRHTGTIEQRILAMTPEERVAAGAR